MDHELAALYFTQVLNEHDEKDLSNPEERKEVTIGKKILNLIQTCESSDVSYKDTLEEIKKEATALLKMHGVD